MFKALKHTITKVMPYAVILLFGFYLTGCGSSKKVSPSADSDPALADSTSADSTRQITEAEIEARKEFEERYKEELQAVYHDKANRLTTYYSTAQRLFYMGNYENALYHINQAAEIKKTADILALRGSIYLRLNNLEKFSEEWRTALNMDPDVPIPNIPSIINQLKAHGLINNNYNSEN